MDACLCPRCRQETSLTSIVPYRKKPKGSNEEYKVNWYCNKCWPIVEHDHPEEEWQVVPKEKKDMLFYWQAKIWNDDNLS